MSTASRCETRRNEMRHVGRPARCRGGACTPAARRLAQAAMSLVRPPPRSKILSKIQSPRTGPKDEVQPVGARASAAQDEDHGDREVCFGVREHSIHSWNSDWPRRQPALSGAGSRAKPGPRETIVAHPRASNGRSRAAISPAGLGNALRHESRVSSHVSDPIPRLRGLDRLEDVEALKLGMAEIKRLVRRRRRGGRRENVRTASRR